MIKVKGVKQQNVVKNVIGGNAIPTLVTEARLRLLTKDVSLSDAVYKAFKPILISETEKIEVGDWYLHYNSRHNSLSKGKLFKADSVFDKGNNPNEILVGEGRVPYNNYKVLALPEHFSAELQMILDGKLKDGDKVLVECEVAGFDNEGCWTSWTQIKLNSSSHITIYPVKERSFTQSQWFELMNQYLDSDYASVPYDDQGINGFKEWFEQNIK